MNDSFKTFIDFTIQGIDESGLGYSLDENKNMHLVPYTLSGEQVRVNFENKVKKKNYYSIINLLEQSEERSKEVCEHFQKCGGCLLQHWKYEHYETWKFELIKKPIIKLIPKTKILKMISAKEYSRRRSKFFLHNFNNNFTIGFKRFRSHDFIDIKNCAILDPEIMNFINSFKIILKKSVLPKCNLIININKLDFGLDILIQTNKSLALDKLVNLFQNINARIVRVSLQYKNQTPDLILMHHKNKISFDNQNVYGLIPPGGFFQATKVGEKELIKNILNEIYNDKNISILDLFSGSGTFSLPLLKKGWKVHAIEGNKNSIEALIQASKEQTLYNKIKYNISNLMKDKLDIEFLKQFDLIIIDPPRAGAILQISAISDAKVKKIISISCNVLTFLRDTKLLLSRGYSLKYILPIDQFLYTSHLEIFSVFEYKN